MSKKIEALFSTIDDVVGIIEGANEDSAPKILRSTECLKNKKIAFKKLSSTELKSLKDNLNSLNNQELDEELSRLQSQVKKLSEQTSNLSCRRDELEDSIAEIQEKIAAKEQMLTETETLLTAKQSEFSREIPYLEALLKLYDDLLKVQIKENEGHLVGYVLSHNHVPKIRPFEIDVNATSRYNRINSLWSLM